MAASNLCEIIQKQLDDIHAAGTYKNERVITSPQKTNINIQGSTADLINFCANNYLGMSVSDILRNVRNKKTSTPFISQCNPDVVQYSKQILEKYGSGLSSVRFICGTQIIHKVKMDNIIANVAFRD